jgi:hypothetical protein
VHLLIVSILTLGLMSPAEAQTKSRPPTQAGPQQQRAAKPTPTEEERMKAEGANAKAAAEAREKARDARIRRDTRSICQGC